MLRKPEQPTGSTNGADSDDRSPQHRQRDHDLSAADQTTADADQTSSDADQTLSDMDQTAAESDQRGAEADQAASDRDQTAADRDPSSHDASDAERRQSTAERDATSQARDATMLRRTEHTSQRDQKATRRDAQAAERDRTAEVSDQEAAALGGARTAQALAKAAADRARAAEDRAHAAEDRTTAARDRKRARIELEQAHLDDLTGFYRRGLGTIVLQREIDRCRRSAQELVFAYCDLDGLKRVNDEKGHAAGDALLKGLAAAIRSRLRSYEPVVRVGGDEFVCALPDTGLDQAHHVLTDIQNAFSNGERDASMSFGLADLRAGDSLITLVERCDQALRRTKADQSHTPLPP